MLQNASSSRPSTRTRALPCVFASTTRRRRSRPPGNGIARAAGQAAGSAARPVSGCSPRRANRSCIPVAARIRRGQQLLAVEDRVRAGEEAERLHCVAHLGAPGGQAQVGLRHQQARSRDRAHQVERVERRTPVQRRALDLHQLVDRHALRMLRQRRERVQQLHAIELRLAHAEDAAAADVEPRVAHRLQRVEAVLVGARRDDLAVERLRRVEVVVVVVEPGVLELARLPGRQHAERRAGLEAERAHLAHHAS